jgi:hypothetical protein
MAEPVRRASVLFVVSALVAALCTPALGVDHVSSTGAQNRSDLSLQGPDSPLAVVLREKDAADGHLFLADIVGRPQLPPVARTWRQATDMPPGHLEDPGDSPLAARAPPLA